jgi:2-keto-4-pentenoate hydratase/2-oxohepta-3-ene-1,7-dioic acid hydratase in catechol pathway
MKLVRYGARGAELPGLLDAEFGLRDLSAHVSDITVDKIPVIKAIDPKSLPLVEGKPRLGVPLSGIGNIFAIGLNYRDHAEEAKMTLPTEPVVFSKSTASLNGPFDPVIIPKDSEKTDWEVELAVIIGARASHVSEERALDFVAGYAICNDISERSFQLEKGGQWIKGKSADSFCPLGPWLVTKDEIPDPQALNLWLALNGQKMQDGNSRNMVFPIPFLISYLSRFLTLLPGDVITTGTPAGVGMGRGVYLKPGDVMTLGVAGLGEQRQEVKKYES